MHARSIVPLSVWSQLQDRLGTTQLQRHSYINHTALVLETAVARAFYQAGTLF